MEAVTLTIAALACILVFLSKPIKGLIVYTAVLAWYPVYLTVKIDTIDFTACRIVILAIFANLFFQTDLPRQFKFILLDKLVIIYFVAQIIAGSITTDSLGGLLENRAGAFFDMALPYFAVRLTIRTKEQYITLLKGILIIAAPLAIIGFYQCLTGDNPVGFLKKYHARALEGFMGYVPIRRHGFFRADVTFPMSIMFGLFFAMLGPVCAGLINRTGKPEPILCLGIGLMILGIFSSMSSGPMLAGLLAIAFIFFYPYRQHWKVAVFVIIFMGAMVEIVSNRHFYDVLGSLTFDPVTARWRSRLIEVAMLEGGMSGHWLVGYGDADPGWGAKIDGSEMTDITNHYLLVLSRFGLLGLLPFLAITVTAFNLLVKAFNLSRTNSDKWYIWSLAGALFGLFGALYSVSLFGQPKTILYILFGFCGCIPMITNNRFSLREIGRETSKEKNNHARNKYSIVGG